MHTSKSPSCTRLKRVWKWFAPWMEASALCKPALSSAIGPTGNSARRSWPPAGWAKSPWCIPTGIRNTRLKNLPKIDLADLDWKSFLGSAPDQPFSEQKYLRWRWYWDFGGGMLTDLLTHWI